MHDYVECRICIRISQLGRSDSSVSSIRGALNATHVRLQADFKLVNGSLKFPSLSVSARSFAAIMIVSITADFIVAHHLVRTACEESQKFGLVVLASYCSVLGDWRRIVVTRGLDENKHSSKNQGAGGNLPTTGAASHPQFVPPNNMYSDMAVTR